MQKSPFALLGTASTALFLIAFAALSLWYGGSAAWTDANTLRARWVVSQWRAGTGPAYSLTLWRQTRDELQAALRITPDNAHLMDELGYLHAARAMGLGTPAVGTLEYMLQQRLLTEAINQYRAATRARPTFAYSWAYLTLAKHLKGETDSELWSAFDMALRYGHNEAGVQPAIAQVAFGHWDTLSPQRKNQMTAMLSAARPIPRQALLDLAATAGVVLKQ